MTNACSTSNRWTSVLKCFKRFDYSSGHHGKMEPIVMWEINNENCLRVKLRLLGESV